MTPPNDSTGRTGFRLSTLAAIGFFALALYVSTMFMGDIGVFNDDYFCNQRDVVTGEAHDFVMNRPWHLWRPLLRVVLIPLVTLLWPHPWMLHAISAGLHGLIVGMLYWLLRRLGVRAGIAGPVALGFMLHPVHFEAVLWIDIICTLMSVGLMLAVWHGYVWWITRSHEYAGALRFAALIGMGGLAWCSAAMNEQPPGALGATVLLPLMLGSAQGATVRRQRVRTVLPMVAVSVGLGIYLLGFLHHVQSRPQMPRDAEIVLNFGEHMRVLATRIPSDLALWNFAPGAWKEGVGAIGERPLMGAVLLGCLVALGLVWLVRRTRSGLGDGADSNVLHPRLLAMLGATWVVMAWAPVALAHNVNSPRLHYVPCLGLAMIVAAGLTALSRRLGNGSGIMMLGAKCAFGAAVLAALVVWIGIQAGYQRRCAADRAEMEQIREVFGASLEPETFVMPVGINDHTSATGSVNFDNHFQHEWYFQWASGWRLQQGLRRTDVHTVLTNWGVGVDGIWVSDEDPLRVAKVRVMVAAPHPARLDMLMWRSLDLQGRHVEWNRLLLLDIVSPGVVRFYTKVRLHIPGREPVEMALRQVAINPRAAGLPERVLDVYPLPPERVHENAMTPRGERKNRQ